MQIDPAALSRADSVSNAAKSATQNAPVNVKSSRALISVPRLDLEHAYTDLKAVIGDQWAEYKESTAMFLLGTAHAQYPHQPINHSALVDILLRLSC